MCYEKIQLIPERPWVTLEYIANDIYDHISPAMLVIPGGGYGCVCSDREGYPIANAYIQRDYAAFVLTYSVKEQIKTPFQPLEEAMLAIQYIRANADKYKIDPARVFAVGFSAGGHLAAWLATGWDSAEMRAAYPDSYRQGCPTGAVLCYPVISEYYIREDSFERLYGKTELTREEKDRVCLEKHVSASARPVFIMHTVDDNRVPVENALDFARAYAENKLTFELHIYPHAPHGVALATKVTSMGNKDHEDAQIARWVEDSAIWAEKIHF